MVEKKKESLKTTKYYLFLDLLSSRVSVVVIIINYCITVIIIGFIKTRRQGVDYMMI